MDKTNNVSRQQLKDALIRLGVNAGMVLEVHSSLSSFGHLEGGAMTLIDTLKEDRNARRQYLHAGTQTESGTGIDG